MPIIMDAKAGTKLFDHLSNPDDRLEEYNRLLGFKESNFDLAKHIDFKLADSLELRLIEKPQPGIEVEIVLFDHSKKDILYFNRVERVENPAITFGKPVTQVFIWRNARDTRNRSHGLVQKVFFGFLLDQYDVVVSDSEQTRDGKRMWENLLMYAIDMDGMEAGAIDETSDFKVIASEKDLYDLSTWLWGTEQVHKERLALIRKK